MARVRWLVAFALLGACSDDAGTLPSSGGSTSLGSGTGVATTTGGTTGSGPGETEGSTSTTTPETSSDETGADGSSTGGPPQPPYAQVRYPADRVHSPVTAYVADRWRDYAESSMVPRDDVFLKAGASSTVSANTLHCFENDDTTDLGTHAELADALAFFRGADVGGSSSYGRTTLAAETGRSAAWVVDGTPSPLEQEWDAIDPRWALAHYGTNDMNLGATHGSAMVPFHEAMMQLVDTMLERGTIPVVFGITRRADSATAQLWVESYNAALRGMAQSRQVPFVDLYAAIDPLPEHGLSSDGLHLRAYGQGACLLTDEGLQWGYNMRNLVALEVLDRAMAVLVDDAVNLDDEAPLFDGDGSPDAPWRVDAFPFAHSADTARSPTSAVDAYPPCDDADESGPEFRYRLELDQPTPMRVLVLDGPDVDVDVHIVEAGGNGDTCLSRGDRRIEGEFPAGQWDIVVDTWSSGGETFVGEYLLVVLPCQPEDEACAGILG